MATNKESEIRILNSQSAGATPDVAQMEYGELAINTADDKLFYKRSASGLGTITARDPYMGFEYEYKTAGVTAGTTGGINVTGNTFSIHPEDLDGNDLTSFLSAIKASEKGIVYWAAEDRDKTINSLSFVTGNYKSSPDDTVLTLNGTHLVNNALSDGQKVRVLVSSLGATAEAGPPSGSLRYRFLPNSVTTNSNKFSQGGLQYGEKTGHWWMSCSGYWPLGTFILQSLPFEYFWFNSIDIDGTDAGDFFRGVGPGDILRLENAETFTANGVTYLPGQCFIQWVNSTIPVLGNAWDDNQYIGFFDDTSQNPGNSGDVYISEAQNDGNWNNYTYFPAFDDTEGSESQAFINALEAHNWYVGDTDNDEDGVLFALTRTPSLLGGGRSNESGQRQFGSDGTINLSCGFTGAAPVNNGEIFIDYNYLPTTQLQIHKFGRLAEDNRQLFSDLTNTKSQVNIIRERGYTAGSGSAFATLTIGPATYVSGTYYTFDVLDSITGGTGGTTTDALPSLTAGDFVSVTITPQTTFNNVETVNGLTGGVTLNAGTNVTLTTAAAGITIDGEITDSYTGHIEVVANKDYYLDARSPATRTITEFFVIAGNTGGGTAELKGTNGSIASVLIGVTGATGTLSNTTLPAGGTLEIGVTAGELSEDLRFSVKYTQ